MKTFALSSLLLVAACAGSTPITKGRSSTSASSTSGTGGGTNGGQTSSSGGTTAGHGLGAVDDGGTIALDDFRGHDTPSCGDTASPCQTLTFVLQYLQSNGLYGLTLSATHNGGGGVWSGNETLPLALNNAVTLSAPGIYFQSSASGYFTSFNATVQGAPGNQIRIGFVPLADGGDGDSTATHLPPFVVRGPTVLQDAALASAYVHTGTIANDTYPIDVQAGGHLTLGPGPVHIGETFAPMQSEIGIHCGGVGALLQDVLGNGAVLTVQGQYDDLWIDPGCSVALASNPSFGNPPVDGGCPFVMFAQQFLDQNGIILNAGSADRVSISNGTFQCFYNVGVDLRSGNLSLANTGISGASCAGVQLDGPGTLDLEGSTIEDTGVAVLQNNSTATALVDGGALVCNGGGQLGNCQGGGPGADLVNEGGGTVVAQNVTVDRYDAGFPAPLLSRDGGFPDRSVAVETLDGGVVLVSPMPYTGTCP